MMNKTFQFHSEQIKLHHSTENIPVANFFHTFLTLILPLKSFFQTLVRNIYAAFNLLSHRDNETTEFHSRK